MQRARPERHPLDPSGLEPAVLAEGVRVLERALDDVGDALDVGVRVHRPVGARDEAVVVEHPERPDAHLARVAVSVEGEVPSGGEPAALLGVDLGVATDLQHGSGGFYPWPDAASMESSLTSGGDDRMTGSLDGRTVVVLLAEGFEDLEFWVTVMRLREEGAEVTVAGLTTRPVRGKHGLEASADVEVGEVSAD